MNSTQLLQQILAEQKQTNELLQTIVSSQEQKIDCLIDGSKVFNQKNLNLKDS